MTDEFALNKALDRAAQAEELQRNELLNESFGALKAAYMRAWEATDAANLDGRERIYHQVKAIDDLQERLFRIVGGGKMAQAELDEIAAKAKREKE